jgi:hypothetical protein
MTRARDLVLKDLTANPRSGRLAALGATRGL